MAAAIRKLLSGGKIEACAVITKRSRIGPSLKAEAIYEPDWRSGKAIATRIGRGDGQPMGLAGLWSAWKSPSGGWVQSYTMLTINADEHPLMRNFHKPGDEKRMVVILPEAAYDDWLKAPVDRSMEFIRQYPAERLLTNA